MSEVRYFPRYSQRENIVTNNTLLLFRRLYEVSRDAFARFIGRLGAEDDEAAQEVEQIAAAIGLNFAQQMGTGKSIVDGWIEQRPLKIAIETKLDSGFWMNQLVRHSQVLREHPRNRLLLLLNPTRLINPSIEDVRKQIPEATVLHVTFTDIVAAANECFAAHGVSIKSEITEFEHFCAETGLLPIDGFRMFAPPCKASFEENMNYRLYYNSATTFFRGSQYLGVYDRKAVRAIGHIARRVVCDVDLENGTVEVQSGEPLSEDEERRVIATVESSRRRGWDLTRNHQWFLCDDWAETNFRKTSKGGIRRQRYFDLRKIFGEPIPDMKTVAARLREEVWE